MTAKSPQVSVYFPKDQRAEIDAAAEAAGQTVAAFIRETVMARLHPVKTERQQEADAMAYNLEEFGIDPIPLAVKPITALDLELEPEPVEDPTNAKILELLGQSAPLDMDAYAVAGYVSVADPQRPTTFEGSPIAPPVTSVTTQRQGERCYHFDGMDGVTRWHETATPCPVGTTWAQRIGAADLSITLDGKNLGG